MKKQPDGLTELDINFSNFDHEMPEGLSEALKAEGVWCQHPAWHHWGAIWHENGEFHEKVMRHQVHVATISGKTLRQVIDAVNEQFGGE